MGLQNRQAPLAFRFITKIRSFLRDRRNEFPAGRAFVSAQKFAVLQHRWCDSWIAPSSRRAFRDDPAHGRDNWRARRRASVSRRRGLGALI